MAFPWEKFANQPEASGPWSNFKSGSDDGRVIATTKDGGRVIEGVGGVRSFVSPSYSTNDPEQIAKIMEGAEPADVSMSGFDQATIAQAPAISRVSKFMQGVPFVGEYVDEAAGAMFGDKSRDAIRSVNSAMGRENPKESAALQIGGGVVGSIPIAIASAPAAVVRAPVTLVGKALYGAVIGAVGGGVEGAVSGYGAGEGENRGDAARSRAATGALVGGAIGAVAPAAGSVLKNVFEWAKGKDINIIAGHFKIGKDAARAMKAALENDDFAAAEAAMRRSGNGAMLADAGPGASQLLDTAMQAGGAANRIGREAVEARAKSASAALNKTLDAILGPVEGIKSATRGIARKTAAQRDAAYDMAFRSAIDYASDVGRAIENVVQRIPVGTLKAAVSEANDAMRAEGVRNMQIMAEIAKDGSVTFREMLNVQQIHEIKRALQSIGESETDSLTGKITGAGLRAKKLAGELSDALGNAVPSYRSATKLGGDKIAEQNALLLGRRLLLPGTTRETALDAMKGAGQETRAAAMKGLRGYIDDTIANVQAAITNFDPSNPTAASEAVKLVKNLSSRANREKVSIVLGKARADGLFRKLDEVGAQLSTRANVARNSATAARTAGKDAIDSAISSGPMSALMSGKPVEAARKVVQMMTGQTAEFAEAKKQEIYAEIARALTDLRGKAAQDALSIVQKAIAGQPVLTSEAANVARQITSGGALAAYQSGTKYLEARRSGPRPR